ncbi:MAG: hypothetical protein K0S63_232 [Gammaproteobacteria bacterium]|jgi:hypothetical protein|nr:hypothetical protein [Gammaproteobacteria bacterium]
MSIDWKENFKNECLLAPKLDAKKALCYKYKHIPKSLFKYRKINEFSLKDLCNDSIWCTNADELNDPYDSAFNMKNFIVRQLENSIKLSIEASSLSPTNDEIEKIKNAPDLSTALVETIIAREPSLDKDKLHEAFIHAHQESMLDMNSWFSTNIQKKIRVSCFSERNDDIKMWSLYASEHKGFSLEYNFSVLPMEDLRICLLWPVIYSDNLFDASPYLTLDNLFATRAAISKSSQWEYEKEWRIVDAHGFLGEENAKGRNLSVPTPTAIYLGAKISQEDKSELKKIATDKKIPVYKTKLSPHKLQIEYILQH